MKNAYVPVPQSFCSDIPISIPPICTEYHALWGFSCGPRKALPIALYRKTSTDFNMHPIQLCMNSPYSSPATIPHFHCSPYQHFPLAN